LTEAGGVREQITQEGPPEHRAGAAEVQAFDSGKKGTMTEKLKFVRGGGNIFNDLRFGGVEAENLKLRSDLMVRIVQFYQKSGMTQAAAARALGLTQPRLNALLKGKIGLFSLDALVNIASRAGLNVRLVVKRAA
jgi:predicted XRE-type DNA-binding protein